MTAFKVEQFLALETAVWDALVSGDAGADDRLLADEFLGVYNSGFAGKADHVDQLRTGPVIEGYELSDARIRALAEDVVLLSYRAEFTRRGDCGFGSGESMFVSSVWRRRSGEWRNVFSQDTPAV